MADTNQQYKYDIQGTPISPSDPRYAATLASPPGVTPVTDTGQPNPVTFEVQPSRFQQGFNAMYPTPSGQDTGITWSPEKGFGGNIPQNQGYTRDAQGNVFDAQGNHVTYESLPKGPNGKPLMNLETLPMKETAVKGAAVKGVNQSLGQQPPLGGVTSAEGRMAIDKYVPPQAIAPSPQVTDFFTQDQGMGALIKSFRDYMSSTNQQTSLADTYKQMLKDSGIQELDTQLMNMDKVINGTQEDIKNEITKSGGFATDSQVQALTDSRNKQLIKNYNNLLETRNNKEKYLSTMIGLTEKDRAEADSRFNKSFNMTKEIVGYGQKMQQNAMDKFKWLIDKQGFDGLYNSTGGDQHAVSLIERTLGLSEGGLAKEADQERQKRALDQIKETGIHQPTSVREYEYAKSQGYKGTYIQYRNEDANRKARVPGGNISSQFTQAQINKGAAAAGVDDNIFRTYDYETANYYTNRSSDIAKAQKQIQDELAKGTSIEDIVAELEKQNIPKRVKDQLMNFARQNAPTPKGPTWYNPLTWF